MSDTVGQAWVEIMPSALGFEGRLDRALRGPLGGSGTRGGKVFAQGFTSSASRGSRSLADKMFGSFKGVAATAGIAAGGALVGSILKDAVSLQGDFQQTMNLIAASTGAPQAQMKALSDLAMKLGADTQYSANEAADAMLELGKAGISTQDIMKGAADGTLLLATAGGTNLTTAATIASNAMNTFNLRGRDMAKIAAALAGGANASSASVESLGQGLQQVGPGARNAGLSLQETVAALSAFDAAGIKGSDAGTSLKTMLTNLIPQTKRQAVAMAQVGLFSKQTGSAFVNANGTFKSMTQIAGLLHDKLSGLTEAQRAQALQSIFGSDSARAATVLMNEGAKGIAKYIKATQDQGAAQKMADAAMSGTKGALEQLSGSIDTVKLAIGQGMAPAIAAGARALAAWLPKLVTFGQEVGGKVAPVIGRLAKSAVPALKTLASAAGGFGRDLISAVKTAAPSVMKIAHALAPLVKPALALAIGGAVLAFKALGPVLKGVAGVFAGFVDALTNPAVQASLTGIGVALALIFAPLAAQVALFNVQMGIAILRITVMNGVTTAAAAVTKVWAAMQALLNAAMDANPIGLIVIAIAALVAGFIVAYKKSETFRKIVNGAMRGVAAAAKWVVGFIKSHWKTLLAILTGPFGIAVLLITKNWDKIKAGAGAAKDWIVGRFTALVGFVKGLPGKIGHAAAGMWDGIKNAFRAAINFIIDGWNSIHLTLPEVDTHIPGIGKVGGFTLSVPQLPRLATGGRATGAQLAMIGEGREPETVFPDSVLGGFLERMAAASGGGFPDRVRLVLADGTELDAYFEEIADDRIGAHKHLGDETRRAG